MLIHRHKTPKTQKSALDPLLSSKPSRKYFNKLINSPQDLSMKRIPHDSKK